MQGSDKATPNSARVKLGFFFGGGGTILRNRDNRTQNSYNRYLKKNNKPVEPQTTK